MTSWLVIGGAPSAKEWCPRVKADKVITCNAGLQVCPKADVYWLSDPVAIHRYRPDWEKFEGEIVCNAEIGRRRTEFPYLDKGLLFHGRCSGVLCCRVALSRGATELHLVGFEGYRPEDRWQGVDGKPVAERGEQALKVNEAQEVAFWDISKTHPDVKVMVYGPSLLKWPSSWRRVELVSPENCSPLVQRDSHREDPELKTIVFSRSWEPEIAGEWMGVRQHIAVDRRFLADEYKPGCAVALKTDAYFEFQHLTQDDVERHYRQWLAAKKQSESQ